MIDKPREILRNIPVKIAILVEAEDKRIILFALINGFSFGDQFTLVPKDMSSGSDSDLGKATNAVNRRWLERHQSSRIGFKGGRIHILAEIDRMARGCEWAGG